MVCLAGASALRVYSAAKQKPPSLKTAADSLHHSAALPTPTAAPSRHARLLGEGTHVR